MAISLEPISEEEAARLVSGAAAPLPAPVAAAAAPAVSPAVELEPIDEATALALTTPVAFEPVDPLDDYEIYRTLQAEKEAGGFDPADRGVASKIWEGVKGTVGMLPAVGRGVLKLAQPAGLPVDPEMIGTVAQAAGDLLGNYKRIAEGANVITEKAVNKAVALVNPEREAEMKELSTRAAWNFEREVRDVDRFTGNFAQHLEAVFPRALAGLGAAPVDREAAGGLAMLLDPANYVPAGAAARWTTQVPMRGAVRAAETAVKEASLKVAEATAKRDALKAVIEPLNLASQEGTLAKSYAAAANEVGLLKTRQAEAAKALAATTAAQRSLVDEIATQAAAQPAVTRAVAAGAQGAGRVANFAGEQLQRLAQVPDQLAAKIAGGADAQAQRAIGDGVRSLAGGFGVLPASAGALGVAATRTGQALETYGRILAEAEGQLPFFKRLARETTGITGWAASTIDQSGLGDLITPAARIGANATRGLASPVSLGAVQSGGDLDAALQGAGAGMVLGLAGAGYGQWQRFGNGALFRQRQLADVQRYRAALPGAEAKGFFDKLPGADRAAVATMQLAHPDLKIQYSKLGKGQPSFYYAAEDGPVAVVNLDTRDPLPAVLAHEVGHHVERHGLGPVIDRTLFGDPLVGQPGFFSELNAAGKPRVTTEGVFALNPEWQQLRAAYDGRLAALAAKTGEAVRPRTDAQIGREIFAEHAADYLLGRDGELTRDLRANVWSRAIGGLAKSNLVGGVPMLRQTLGKLGVPLGTGEKRVVGSLLFPGGVPASRDLQQLIGRYHRESVRGRAPALDEDPGNTRYTAAELRQYPQIIEKLFDGTDDVQRTASGKIVRAKDGAPVMREAKEKQAERAALAKELVDELKATPAAGARLEQTPGSEGWVVPGVPDAVIDKIKAGGRFNPVQLEHLRAASQAIRDGAGKSMLFFYQPATKTGKGYQSLAGDWRTETPYALFISNAGNVVVRTMSKEKLMANAQALVNAKRATLWDNNLGALVADVDTYLANHAAGRPGDTGIGAQKRDSINLLFGINTAKNRGANPLVETSPKAPVVIRSRRLDRINRLSPVEEYFPTSYDRLNANLRPEAP